MAWLMWWAMVVFSGSDRFSSSKYSSALAMPAGGEGGGLGLFVHDIVGVHDDVLFLLVVHLGDRQLLAVAATNCSAVLVQLGGFFAHGRR